MIDGPTSDPKYTPIFLNGRNTTVRTECLLSVAAGARLGLQTYFTDDSWDPPFLTGTATSLHGGITDPII